MSKKKLDYHVELYQGKNKGPQVWWWRFLGKNNEIIAKSGEPYLPTSINKAVRNLQSKIKGYLSTVYQGRNKKYYWYLAAKNGKKVASCAKGHETLDEAWKYLHEFERNFSKSNWVKIHNRKSKFVAKG